MKKRHFMFLSLLFIGGCSGSPDRHVPQSSREERVFVADGVTFADTARFQVRHVRLRKVGNKESFSENQVIQMYDSLRQKLKTSVVPSSLKSCGSLGPVTQQTNEPVYFVDVYMQAEIFSEGKLNRQRALSIAIWPFSEAIIDREYLRVDLRMFDQEGRLVAGYDMGSGGAQSWTNLLGLDAAADAAGSAVTKLCSAVRSHSS